MPSVRPRAVMAATIDDRGRSDCRNSRSSGPSAMRRRSSASMRGRKCAIWVQAGSEVTNRRRYRWRAAPQPVLDLGGVRHSLHANCRAHDSALVDRVDHAHVGRFGDDQLGRPAQGLGERQRAIGELADRVEQSQTVGVGAPPVARVGAGHREGPRGDDRRQADRVVGDRHRPAIGGSPRRAGSPGRRPAPFAAGPLNSAQTKGAMRKVPVTTDDGARITSTPTRAASTRGPGALPSGSLRAD